MATTFAPPPPSPTRAGPVVAVAAGATFLAFLDVTVVNLAFPAMSRTFATAGVGDLAWVITAYAVLFAAVLAPAGRLADAVGRRATFVLAVALFTVSSVLAALAGSLALLVVARAVQGVAAGAMLPAGLGLVLTAVPSEERGKAIGAWGAAGGLAAAFGPSLGGVLVDVLGWRSVFWLNLPLGALLVALALRTIPADQTRGAQQRPDLVGTASLATGLALLVLALTKSAEWSGSTTGWLGAVGIALLVVTLRLSVTHPVPAIDVSLWRHREFAAANGASLLMGAALYTWLLLGVLWLTQVWHYSVLKAGLAMTPGALTAAVGAVLAGRATTLVRQRQVLVSTALTYAVLVVVLSRVLTTEPHFLALWLPGSLIAGGVVGAALTAITAAASGALPPARFAAGVGLNLTARQVGGALGIAVLALIVSGTHDVVGSFLDVLAVCGVFAAAAAAIGTRLVEVRR